MTTVRRLLGLASAAALTAALVPAPAHAAVPPDPNAVLVAGPAPKTFAGVPDKWVNETIEVRNDSDKPLRVVLHVKTQGLWFASSYITCKYSDSLPYDQIPVGTEEALCQPPNEIEPGGSYKFGGGMIRVHPMAQPGAEYSYSFTWYTKEFADAQGPTWLGRDKLTHGGFKTLPLMTKVTPETPYTGTNSGSGTVKMAAGQTPPTTPPATPTTPATTATPTVPPGGGETEPTNPIPSSSPAATVSPTTVPPTTVPPVTEAPGGAGGGGGDTGGDLPLTGTNVAVMGGLGVVLLGGGAAAFLLARRRRTSFTA